MCFFLYISGRLITLLPESSSISRDPRGRPKELRAILLYSEQEYDLFFILEGDAYIIYKYTYNIYVLYTYTDVNSLYVAPTRDPQTSRLWPALFYLVFFIFSPFLIERNRIDVDQNRMNRELHTRRLWSTRARWSLRSTQEERVIEFVVSYLSTRLEILHRHQKNMRGAHN